MQLPELFRRGVVRPLDDDAERQLSQFHIEEPVRVEWLPIPDESEFSLIWKSGVFQHLNCACGIGISDYEEEVLSANSTQMAIDALRQFQRNRSGDSVSRFLGQLDSLLSDAQSARRSVYFIF